MASTRPPCADSSLCILACMALSEATSNRPRPRPDWLDAITTWYPAWFMRAMASRAPGSGCHSCGDLMYWSLSTLMVPSRSRMTSFIGGSLLDDQARQVGHAVHGAVQGGEQAQAVGAQLRVLGVDHHVVEEPVDRRTQRGQRLQRGGVVAGTELLARARRDVAHRRMQRLFGRFAQQRVLHLRLHGALGLLQ